MEKPCYNKLIVTSLTLLTDAAPPGADAVRGQGGLATLARRVRLDLPEQVSASEALSSLRPQDDVPLRVRRISL